MEKRKNSIDKGEARSVEMDTRTPNDPGIQIYAARRGRNPRAEQIELQWFDTTPRETLERIEKTSITRPRRLLLNEQKHNTVPDTQTQLPRQLA